MNNRRKYILSLSLILSNLNYVNCQDNNIISSNNVVVESVSANNLDNNEELVSDNKETVKNDSEANVDLSDQEQNEESSTKRIDQELEDEEVQKIDSEAKVDLPNQEQNEKSSSENINKKLEDKEVQKIDSKLKVDSSDQKQNEGSSSDDIDQELKDSEGSEEEIYFPSDEEVDKNIKSSESKKSFELFENSKDDDKSNDLEDKALDDSNDKDESLGQSGEVIEELYAEDVLQGLSDEHVPKQRNWFTKKVLWRKAKPKYESIREKVQHISTYANKYLEKQNEILSGAREFFLDVGINNQQIKDQIENIEKEIKNEQEKEGLTSDQNILLEELERNKEELEKINNSLQDISKLRNLVRDAVSSAISQIKIVESYEHKAYEAYDQIGETIDRDKAEKLYNTLENLLENSELKEKYIAQDINNYIEESRRELENIKLEVKSLIEDLKQKGIDIKNKFDDEEEKQEEARLEKLEKERLERIEQRKMEKSQSGWLNSIYNWFKSWFRHDNQINIKSDVLPENSTEIIDKSEISNIESISNNVDQK